MQKWCFKMIPLWIAKKGKCQVLPTNKSPNQCDFHKTLRSNFNFRPSCITTTADRRVIHYLVSYKSYSDETINHVACDGLIIQMG